MLTDNREFPGERRFALHHALCVGHALLPPRPPRPTPPPTRCPGAPCTTYAAPVFTSVGGCGDGGLRTDEEEITRVSAGSTSAQTSHPHRRQPSHRSTLTRNVWLRTLLRIDLHSNMHIFSRAFSATHLNDARSASANQNRDFFDSS